jgi:uncharacterized membrane protein (DUF106 family)
MEYSKKLIFIAILILFLFYLLFKRERMTNIQNEIYKLKEENKKLQKIIDFAESNN